MTRLLSLTPALLVVACGYGSEPVLLGVQPEDAAEPSASVAPRQYQKPAEADVDIPYIAGRPWEEVRDIVNAQLGDVTAVRELDPRDGKEYQLTHGLVRVKDGLVYLVRVDFESPTRRSAALVNVGMAPQVDHWYELSGEFRLRWEGGFERVRMGRYEEGSEMVTWVEALRWNPRTNRGR